MDPMDIVGKSKEDASLPKVLEEKMGSRTKSFRGIQNIIEILSEELIWELFVQAGPVVNVYVPKDRVTNLHQNYGFIEYRSEEDADYVIKVLNMIKLYGKPIRVNKFLHHNAEACKVSVRLGRVKDGLNGCNEALNIDEELIEALHQRGEAKLLLEDWEGAVEDLKQAAQSSQVFIFSENLFRRWLGYGFGSLLLLNHFSASGPISESQLRSEDLGLSLAAFSIALPFIGKFLKGSVVEQRTLPEEGEQIFVISSNIGDSLKEDLAWETYVLLNTSTIAVVSSVFVDTEIIQIRCQRLSYMIGSRKK